MAQRAGAHVLVDEVYLEMLFDRAAPFCFPIGAFLAPAAENPFIVTSSLTKAYGLSGLRCGWVLASPDLAAAHLASERPLRVRRGRTPPNGCRSWPSITWSNSASEREQSSPPIVRCSMHSSIPAPIWNASVRLLARWFSRGCRGTRRLSSPSCARNMKPRSCPEPSSKCRSISASASAARRRSCAGLERLGAALDKFGKR